MTGGSTEAGVVLISHRSGPRASTVEVGALRRLRELLERSGGAPPVDPIAVNELVAFAMEQRYGSYDSEPVDRAELLDLAERVLAWAEKELSG